MDIRDGRIYESSEVELTSEDRQYLRQMEYHPTPYQRTRGRVGRNDPYPCGSGKKFKRCHFFKKDKKS